MSEIWADLFLPENVGESFLILNEMCIPCRVFKCKTILYEGCIPLFPVQSEN